MTTNTENQNTEAAVATETPAETPEPVTPEPVATEPAAETPDVATTATEPEPKADKPKPKPKRTTGKGAKGTAKKRKPKADVPPAKWKPGGQQLAVFRALRRKGGATGDDCNKAYWPQGDKKAGWRCVIDKKPYEWAKRSGCNGYVKREGRKVRLWLRNEAEIAKFGEPEGAKRIFTYKAPKAA